ncbi:MAG: YdcF family protein [Kiritimatiellaeota bacterium]|nr:YdcF family protein [Kiritimatiellota bacterium]
MRITKKLFVRLVCGIVACACLAVFGAAQIIASCSKGRTYSDSAFIPHNDVGLVLGCSRTLPDGRGNLFFAHRIAAAARLFEAGKINAIIVSGDNHAANYDEPTDMKDALISAGVPAERIYCDYAGFRTLDSVVRVKAIFGQHRITIISQRFHNQRAICIARHNGIDAIGFNAQEVSAPYSTKTKLRELFARVKTVLDILFGVRPKFLGPPVEIKLPLDEGVAPAS